MVFLLLKMNYSILYNIPAKKPITKTDKALNILMQFVLQKILTIDGKSKFTLFTILYQNCCLIAASFLQ